MARGTPLKWIQEQGGWTTAKLLLDTYGHYLPTESHCYADAISTAPNGAETAPSSRGQEPWSQPLEESAEASSPYEDADSEMTPRSPIMHFTLPPPFLRNSDTSTTTGVTPRSSTSSRSRSDTPEGITR